MTLSHSKGRRSEAKRAAIVDAAMRHFAKHGYEDARVEDIARELGIAKGSVFQHFANKQGLFLAAYKRATGSLPAYHDVPEEIQARGFFSILRYWLERTDHLIRQDWVPYRVSLLGNYGTSLALRLEINRFLTTEDPYQTVAFVRGGLARGELRTDVDQEMIVSIVDWTVERFQDALLTNELEPGLFRRYNGQAERTQARIEQFLLLLRSAIGAPASARRRQRASRVRKSSA